MRRAALLAALLTLTACAPAEPPKPPPGEAVAAPAAGTYEDSQRTTAPDGKTAVFVRTEHAAAGDITSLWIALPEGGQRRLLVERPNPGQPHLNLIKVSRPLFSLDGAFVYFNAASWPASDSLQRYELATGQVRYLTDGRIIGIVAAGARAGNLLLSRHRYSPSGGVFTPVQLVGPSGRTILRIPEGGSRTGLARWATAEGLSLTLVD